MCTQKQKLLLNRSHLKKNVFVLFTVSTQEYIPRAYKYYELEECQNVFVSILYDIKFMYLVCSWPNMLTFITVAWSVNLTEDNVACGIYWSHITHAMSGQLQTLHIIPRYV